MPASYAFRLNVVEGGVMTAVGTQLLDAVKDIGPMLREAGEEGERQHRLPARALNALKSAGLHRMLLPKSLGGLEVDPFTCAHVIETVAGFDSAVAWVLQNNSGAWWAARLPEEGVNEIYGANADAFMTAAFHPPQSAVEVPGGYRLSGRAPLASIVHDSEWVLLTGMVMENGAPKMVNGAPEVVGMVFPTCEVQIIDTWQSLGMRATDSNDVAVDNVFAPASRTFHLTPQFTPGKHFQGPLYRFPAIGETAIIIAPVLLATARAAIDEFRQLAGAKTPLGSMKVLRDRGVVQSSLARAEGMLRSARTLFYETVTSAWERTAGGRDNTLEHRADLLLAGVHAANSAWHVVDLMHRLAGTSGIYTRSRLERLLRDALTIRHHGFVSESKYETVGQVYLGVPPEFALVAF
jgi:alkylation response protein AidB-like acyl-CoA dehydrogenase